jgi:hemerythrin
MKQWTEDLSVGVEEIDSQHKEFINSLNGLLDAMARGRGRQEIGNTIDFLERYINSHFDLEEEYMRVYMYPAYQDHKAKHTEFRIEVSKLRQEFNEKGSAIRVVLEAERGLINWFFKHIREVDRELGKFLKGRLKK